MAALIMLACLRSVSASAPAAYSGENRSFSFEALSWRSCRTAWTLASVVAVFMTDSLIESSRFPSNLSRAS